jgi:hypothetical protein
MVPKKLIVAPNSDEEVKEEAPAAPVVPIKRMVPRKPMVVLSDSDEEVKEEAPVRPLTAAKAPVVKASVAKPLTPVVKTPAVKASAIKAPVAKAPSVVKSSPLVKSVVETPLEVADVAEAKAIQKPQIIQLTYKQSIAKAMAELDRNRNQFLNLEADTLEQRLANYSPKLDKMLRNIINSNGSNLVYSQFKTVEGLGVLSIAMKANGFFEIEIQGSESDPYFSPQTVESLRRNSPARAKVELDDKTELQIKTDKRFIAFTGEGSKERRNLILNIFNGRFDKLPERMRTVLEEEGYGERANNYGEICWVIGITGAGAEGISLKSCRTVHIMEPYWNNVRLEQVSGRAVRICSHMDLPFHKRNVKVFLYYTTFSQKQLADKQSIEMTIRTTDKDKTSERVLTSDENVFHVSNRKNEINHQLLTIMKESAVDCQLNTAENDGVQCLIVDGKVNQYLFDPNLEVDKINSKMTLKETKTFRAPTEASSASSVTRSEDAASRSEDAASSAASAALSAAPSAAPSVVPAKKAIEKTDKLNLAVIRYKGIQYIAKPVEGTNGTLFHLCSNTDITNVQGEIRYDFMKKAYYGVKIY